MSRNRWGVPFLTLALLALVLAADSSPRGEEGSLPPAVNPDPGPPTVAELARRELALLQPLGRPIPGSAPASPVIANPSR